MKFIIIILILTFALYKVYKVFIETEDKSSQDINGEMELLGDIMIIINNTNNIPTNNLNKEEYFMRDYIVNNSFKDLVNHPKYFHKDSIEAYRETYDKVNRYYNLISSEGRISRRNAEIDEILK